ncbi:hypothetical protein D3C85_381110 [compost metagenome]
MGIQLNVALALGDDPRRGRRRRTFDTEHLATAGSEHLNVTAEQRLHACAAVQRDVAVVANGIARHIGSREQRRNRVATPQITALARAVCIGVFQATGTQLGEVHLTREHGLLGARQCGVERPRLFGAAVEAVAQGQPGQQFFIVGLDHLTRLIAERRTAGSLVFRVQVTGDEATVIRPIGPCTRLQHQAGTRTVITRHYWPETGDARAIFHQDIAPGIDLQRAGAGNVEAAVDDVAPSRDAGDIVCVVVDEQVARGGDGVTAVAHTIAVHGLWLSDGCTRRDDIASGQHPDRPGRFVPGAFGVAETQGFATANANQIAG